MLKNAVHKTKHVDFDQFVADPEILGLSGEIAVLRSAMVEFRESLDNRHVNNVNNFIKGIIKDLDDDDNWEMDGAEYSTLRKAILSNFCKTFGQNSFINARDVSVIAKLADITGKLVERAKKIEDGITVDLDWKGNMIEILQKFIQLVVCPVVKDRNMIAMICHRGREFFNLASSKVNALNPGDELVISASEVIDVD